jgi:hypothetical protein
MGKYYRNGKLWSGETFYRQGSRTLAAATESFLWGGTDPAPSFPASVGEQVKLVSTSAQDDAARQKTQTITITGTMDPVTTDEWDVLLAGGVDTGDVIRLTLNGVNYDTAVAGGASIASLVAEIATSAGSGTWDTKRFAYAGTIDVGDTARLTINGVNYDAVSTLGTGAEIASLLAAAAVGDTLYDVTQVGGSDTIVVKKKARGVGSTVTSVWTVDTGSDATVTTTTVVTGVAGQADWTCTDDGVNTVNCLNAASGVTADTVASSVPTDGGGATTFVSTHTVIGAAADILRVTDGTTTFSRTVASAVLNDEVAALAALINADAAYIATCPANVITVVAAVDGVDFAFSSTSVDNQTADLSVVIATTLANGLGTGIGAVRLDYVDADGVEQYETISLNGLTAVTSTATDVAAIASVTATSVGTGGSAAGTITVKDVGSASTYATIPVGACEAKNAIQKIPAGRVGYITAIHASAGATATTVKVKSNANPVTGAVVSGASFIWNTAIFGPAPSSEVFQTPLGPFPAGALIWATGTHTAGTACECSLEGFLEPA